MKEYIAEFIGTFGLVFIGAGAILANNNIVGVSLAHGLVLMCMIYSLSHISGGHFNPAVSISMLITKRISLNKTIFYILSQILGSIFAAILLQIIFNNLSHLNLGTPYLALGVSFWKGVFIEAILTFFLVLTIFGVAIDKRGSKEIYGFAIGLVLTFDILVGGNLTGASMNPARTFGPALISGFWNNHLVYWIGPFLGSIIAAYLYDKILLNKEENL